MFHAQFCLQGGCVALLAAGGMFFPLLLRRSRCRRNPGARQRTTSIAGSCEGDQVYTCKEGVTQFAWTLRRPTRSCLIRMANPSANISRGLPGKRATVARYRQSCCPPRLRRTRIDSVAAGDIVNHEGTGVLSRLRASSGLHTKGGKSPASGCDAAHAARKSACPIRPITSFTRRSKLDEGHGLDNWRRRCVLLYLRRKTLLQGISA